MLPQRTLHLEVTADDGQNMALRGRLEDPFHNIVVSLVLDKERLRILSAEGGMSKVPYIGGCRASLPKLNTIAGLEIRQGFIRELRSRLGDEMGCPYLVELADQLCRFGLVVVKSDEARRLIDAGEKDSFPSLRNEMGKCAGHSLCAKDELPQWLQQEMRDKTT